MTVLSTTNYHNPELVNHVVNYLAAKGIHTTFDAVINKLKNMGGDNSNVKIKPNLRGAEQQGTEDPSTIVEVTRGTCTKSGQYGGGKHILIKKNGRWNPCPKDYRSPLYKAILPRLSTQWQDRPCFFESGTQADDERNIAVKYMLWGTLKDIQKMMKTYSTMRSTNLTDNQGAGGKNVPFKPGAGQNFAGLGQYNNSTFYNILDQGNAVGNMPIVGPLDPADDANISPEEPPKGANDYFGSDYTMIQNFQKKYRFRNPYRTRCKFTIYELQAREDAANLPQNIYSQYYVQQAYAPAYRVAVDLAISGAATQGDMVNGDFRNLELLNPVESTTGASGNPPDPDDVFYRVHGLPYHRKKAMKNVFKEWKVTNRINTSIEGLGVIEYVSTIKNWKWYQSKEYDLTMGQSTMLADGTIETGRGTNIIGGLTRCFLMVLQGPDVFSVEGGTTNGDKQWRGTVPYTQCGKARVDIFGEQCWAVQGSIKENRTHIIQNRIIDKDAQPNVLVEGYPRLMPEDQNGNSIGRTAGQAENILEMKAPRIPTITT